MSGRCLEGVWKVSGRCHIGSNSMMLFLETRIIAILFRNKDVLCQAKSKPSICNDKQTTSITFETLMKHFLNTFDTLL